jgi:tetratricopeptide (TPR) repeat protein
MKRLFFSLLTVVILNFGSSVAALAVEPETTGTWAAASASGSAVVSARDNDILWEEANTAYYAGDFASAAALYDSIELSRMVSPKLYYNKAGALFKMGKIGESILYYSKAQRLAPGDADIAHNLAVVGSYTRNKIEPLPEFFLKRWMRSVRSVMDGDGWAWLSVGLFACVLAGALFYLLPLSRRIRKTGFWGGIAALVLLIFAFSFARHDRAETLHPSGGIVTSPSAAVKSSPDNSGKDLFVLYEGDRVRVLDAMNGWSEITVANGNRGWIRTSTVSMID